MARNPILFFICYVLALCDQDPEASEEEENPARNQNPPEFVRWAQHHQTPRHCARSPGVSLNLTPRLRCLLSSLHFTLLARQSKTPSLVFELANSTTSIYFYFFIIIIFFSQRHHPWSSSTSTTRTSKCCTPRLQTWTSGNAFCFYLYFCDYFKVLYPTRS